MTAAAVQIPTTDVLTDPKATNNRINCDVNRFEPGSFNDGWVGRVKRHVHLEVLHRPFVGVRTVEGLDNIVMELKGSSIMISTST